MSIKCSGKKDGGVPCKITVPDGGGYCRFHLDQKVKRDPCQCLLENGSNCPCPAVKNGFCEYHPEPLFCQGKTLLGGMCLKAIVAGKFCWNCKRQKDVIMDSIKESADSFRQFLSKDGIPVVPTKKASTMFMLSNITIPSNLKKIEIAKPDDCCICMDPMIGNYGTDYRKLGCSHFFHNECTSKLCKMECPMCRAPINGSYLPKWVVARIEENIVNLEKERQEEQIVATHQFIQTIVRNEILDMNSSEEEDYDMHVEGGTAIDIQLHIGPNGEPRIALAFGTSP